MAEKLSPITTKGDLIIGDNSGNSSRLAVGTDTHVLTADSTVAGGIKWAAASGGGFTNLTQFVSQTAHRLFYSDVNGDVQELAFGTSGQFLKSNGATSDPSWDSPAGAGTVTDFIFTDGNGFDGTVTLSTSTPTLSLTTTVGDGQVHYTTTGGAVAGSANLTYDASLLTALSAGLGVTQVDTKGIVLINTTAAAAGAQQISPAIRWSGQGWRTTATAASREVEWRAYALPIEGTTNPSTHWVLQNSINAGTYFSIFRVSSNANLMLGSSAAIDELGGFSIAIGTGTITNGSSYAIAMNGSTASATGAMIFSQNASSASANTFIAGGQNTIIDSGANGSHSLGTDCHIHTGALYAFVANDANEAWGEGCTVFGFGNDVYDDYGFAAGTDHFIGDGVSPVSGEFIAGFALGNNNEVSGNSAGSLGQNNISIGNNAITIGRSVTSSAADAITIGLGGGGAMTNSVAQSFAVGFNSTVPTFHVRPGSGAGTFGRTDIMGNLFLNTVAQDDAETKLLVWNSTDKVVEYRDVSSISGGSGITRTVVVTSGSITLGNTASTDYMYFVAGAHTLSMPAASGNTNRYSIKNNHSANITIDTAGAETIEGAASISIAPEESVDVMSDGTNWYVI